MNPLALIGVSIVLQFLAAFLALRLVRLTGKVIAWLLIAGAIFLMAIRRSFTLMDWWLFNRPTIPPWEITTELVALLTSLLLVFGLILIEPLFLALTRSEEEARKSATRYRTLVNNIPAVVFTGYADGRAHFFDQKVQVLTGFPKEVFASGQVKWLDCILEEDLPGAKSIFLTALKNGGSYVREYRIRDKAGELRWIQERSHIVCDARGNIDQIDGVFFDISERKSMEEKLRQSEERFRAFMDHSPAAAFMKDREGHYLYVNGVCERFARKPIHEWLGLTDFELWPETIAQRHRDSDLEVLAANLPQEFLVSIPGINGALTYWSVYKFLLRPESPDQPLIGGMAVDITARCLAEEQKAELEAQLLQVQKLEAVGRLAGGVAHDFNNLLLAILGYCELMMLEIGPDHPSNNSLTEIDRAANRGAALTRQLLAFSRKQILQPRVINLNEVVSELDNLLRRLIGEDIELLMVLEAELGAIKADPAQIEQVVMNLAVNARDAMPKGGALAIETTNVELDEEYALKHLEVTPGPYVLLTVSDNGMGIEGETLSHIFEPFFTTKENGKGTGLGLAMVYGIVKQSGGHIWVYSEPGQGTTFKIYFPREDGAVTEDHDGRSDSLTLRGKETILVVEDDEAVRFPITKTLRRFGYQVMEAGYGEEALKVWQTQTGPIDLLVTDVVMPRMSGHTLAQQLSAAHPGLKVLYMSGYSDNAIVHHGILESGLNFIQKPFTMLKLLQKVRQVLDTAGLQNQNSDPSPG